MKIKVLAISQVAPEGHSWGTLRRSSSSLTILSTMVRRGHYLAISLWLKGGVSEYAVLFRSWHQPPYAIELLLIGGITCWVKFVDIWHRGKENQLVKTSEAKRVFKIVYSSFFLTYSFNAWQIILKILKIETNLKQTKVQRTRERRVGRNANECESYLLYFILCVSLAPADPTYSCRQQIYLDRRKENIPRIRFRVWLALAMGSDTLATKSKKTYQQNSYLPSTLRKRLKLTLTLCLGLIVVFRCRESSGNANAFPFSPTSQASSKWWPADWKSILI